MFDGKWKQVGSQIDAKIKQKDDACQERFSMRREILPLPLRSLVLDPDGGGERGWQQQMPHTLHKTPKGSVDYGSDYDYDYDNDCEHDCDYYRDYY